MSVSFNKHDEHDHPAPLSYARRGAPSLLDPQAAKSVARMLHRRHPPLFTTCKRLSRRCACCKCGWPPPRKCLQKRARIVWAKRVRTRPFVGSPGLRPASGPRRRRYDEGMMKCPPVKACLGGEWTLGMRAGLRLCGLGILVARKPSRRGMSRASSSAGCCAPRMHRDAACTATVPCFDAGGGQLPVVGEPLAGRTMELQQGTREQFLYRPRSSTL
jgi:hypothetical protein